MLLKILGSVLLICSGGCLGMLHGMRGEMRKRELEDIKRGLSLMYSETEFGQAYLADMCMEAAKICSHGIDIIFSSFAGALTERSSEDIADIWAKSVESSSVCNHLTEEDIRTVSAMGTSLGAGDINRQLRAISELMDYTELKCTEISMVSSKNIRLYKNAGFILGAFVVILLF